MILYEKKFVSLHHKIDKKTILSPFGDDFVTNKKQIRNETNRIFTSYAYDATAHPRQNR